MPIESVRRTPAMAMDNTCTRLEAMPEVPLHGERKALTGGWIVDLPAEDGLERWRFNGDGTCREYYKFKAELVRGQCPWSHVWWAE